MSDSDPYDSVADPDPDSFRDFFTLQACIKWPKNFDLPETKLPKSELVESESLKSDRP